MLYKSRHDIGNKASSKEKTQDDEVANKLEEVITSDSTQDYDPTYIRRMTIT
jgi:hypothetical protein